MKNSSGKSKDMWNSVVKKSTDCCPKPKYNTGLKNNSLIRPQSK